MIGPGDPSGWSLRLRVATYNVHECIGPDQVYAPSRVVTVLRELDADIIALQEISTREHEGRPLDTLKYLAGETGMDAVPGYTLERGIGPYGNAILCRHRVHVMRAHDLTIAKREPRGALEVVFEISGAFVRVLATHLGLRASERADQIDRLHDLIRADELPVVLLGDFNVWSRLLAAGRTLRRALGRVHQPRSYPSRFPLLALDRIWVRPESAFIVPPRAHRSRAARGASDHLPVVADIELTR